MTKLGKEFSVACNGKVLSTYRFPGADLVLFTKITSSPPKYQLLHQNIESSTKICGGVIEQLARYTTRYQESDLHLAFNSS